MESDGVGGIEGNGGGVYFGLFLVNDIFDFFVEFVSCLIVLIKLFFSLIKKFIL